MKLTGGEIVAESLIAAGVPYIAGIPGHGCLGLADAFIARKDRITLLNVRQENAAAHLADGYYRTCGRPLAAFTSIGPGACNAVIGAATAFVDSTPVLILTGGTHVVLDAYLEEESLYTGLAFKRISEPYSDPEYNNDSQVVTMATHIKKAVSIMKRDRPAVYRMLTQKDERIIHGELCQEIVLFEEPAFY